jgi:transglycosylase-like protein with SLT domain
MDDAGRGAVQVMPYRLSDPLLNQIMLAESSGNPNAVSPAGAIGLMQIMPSTAAQYGVSPEMLRNPQINAYLGRRIFLDYLAREGGDLTKALEAYKAGPGNVAKGKISSGTAGYAAKIEQGFNRALSAMGPSSAAAQEVPPPWLIPKGMKRKFKNGKIYENKNGVISEVPQLPPASLIPEGMKRAFADGKIYQNIGGKVSEYVPPVTPEQRYEKAFQQLPRAAQVVAPSTIGEAGFMIGSLPAAGAALGLVPETGGLSLAAPILMGMLGGAMEDPTSIKNALSGASWEGIKGVGQEILGRTATASTELLTRALGKGGILQRSLERIAPQAASLFYEYPLPIARTPAELRSQLGGAEVTNRVGQRLGQFRDALEQRFGKYTPGQAPKLLPATSGQPYRYTAAVAPSGQSFKIYDLDADGNITQRTVGIKDAIDTTRELFAGSRTAGGVQKASAAAPKQLDVAVMNRATIKDQLNRLEPGLGDKYVGYSSDYAVATQLQKVFAGSERTARIRGKDVGVIDQPKLLKKMDTAEARLNKIKPGAGTRLHEAVSPTGASAREEMPFGPRLHGGEGGIRAYMHLPVPYKPETRQLLPWQARVLSDPRLAPLLGALGLSGTEYELGVK